MCKRYRRWSTDESWTRTSSTMATNWNRNPIKELRMQDSHRKVWKVELLPWIITLPYPLKSLASSPSHQTSDTGSDWWTAAAALYRSGYGRREGRRLVGRPSEGVNNINHHPSNDTSNYVEYQTKRENNAWPCSFKNLRYQYKANSVFIINKTKVFHWVLWILDMFPVRFSLPLSWKLWAPSWGQCDPCGGWRLEHRGGPWKERRPSEPV